MQCNGGCLEKFEANMKKTTEKDPLRNIEPGFGIVMVKTGNGKDIPVSKPTDNINALAVTEEIANQQHGNAYIIMSEDERPNKG